MVRAKICLETPAARYYDYQILDGNIIAPAANTRSQHQPEYPTKHFRRFYANATISKRYGSLDECKLVPMFTIETLCRHM